MNKKRQRIYPGLFGVMLVILLGITGWRTTAAAEEAARVEVIFVTDIHSHFAEFSTKIDGKDMTIGGVARMQTMIEERVDHMEEALFLDGGDFSMGTLLQTVYREEAAELRLLGKMGCDATVFGNHEFDYRSNGLAEMLNSAVASGDKLPELVLCNVDWARMEKDGLTEGQQSLKAAFEGYQIKDYTMLEKNGVNIAVIGVFGKEALEMAPTCELVFTDPVEAVKRTVKTIQETEEADMIVCVSHSGTKPANADKSEDEILARQVPELDLILSGHSHISMPEPIQYGDTYVVSSGSYGERLGTLDMVQKENGRWQIENYELALVDTSAVEHPEIKEAVDYFMAKVDTGYLEQFGYQSADEVLAENAVEFSTVTALSTDHTEQNLGSMIADAYAYMARKTGAVAEDDICIAVAPSGTIRDTFVHGNITVNSVFNSFSLGVGADGVVGYPLICVQMSGKALRMAAEVDATISDFMPTARLYMSGLNFTYNPHRILMNKVSEVYVTDAAGKRYELEDDRMYTVVSDLYSAQMIGAVTDLSYGLIDITLCDMDGNTVEDYSDVIMKQNNTEVKAWYAIAQYMQSFADTNGNGVPDVPESYASLQGRKVVDDSRSLTAIFSNLNVYAVVILLVCLLVIVLLAALVVLLVKLVRKHRKVQM